MALRHGTRTKYNSGCRCSECKQAASDYEKARRQRINAGKHSPAKLTALPTPAATDTMATDEPGPVEAGVLAEIGELSTTATRPGLVQIAIAMAKVLDTPLATAQHGSTGKALAEILDKIRKGAEPRRSKLAAVRQMTKPAEAAG